LKPEDLRADAQRFFQFRHPDDADAWNQSVLRSAAALSVWNHEYRLVLPGHGVVWQQGHASPELQADGSIIWYGIITDITARKATEHQLRWASAVFEDSTEPLALIHCTGQIEAVNQALLSQTGFLARELIGQSVGLILETPQAGEAFSDWCVAVQAHWSGLCHGLRRHGERYPAWLRLRRIGEAHPDLNQVVLLVSMKEKLPLAPDQEWLPQEIQRDALTGLWNREQLILELERSIQNHAMHQAPIVLIYIDLDRFKEINDVWGHREGDRLLAALASRLKLSAGQDDYLARMGGDEFAVLMQGESALLRAEAVSRKFIESLAEPFELGGESVFVTASIGLSEYPKDAPDAAGLLICADQSMYQAKEEGKDKLQHFDAGPLVSIRRRRRMAEALRRALKNKPFSLVYQPIVDVNRQLVVKAEALIRWHCPEFPDVTPAEFIPLAEEMGLIAAIGDWVFEEVLQFVIQLKAAGFRPIRISINKSASEFMSPDSIAHWVECLDAAQITRDWVGIEITETMLLDGSAAMKSTLDEVRRCGFKLSLDDFGTGYSAMSYLLRFDLDYLKIDQSFIRNLQSERGQAIVEAMIVMSHKLGLQVIAEGVETLEETVFLRSIACDLVQGYFYSKPLTGPDFMNWCAAHLKAVAI